ncbi:MAG: hypothetical protein G01um101472_187 [Parcubacteria group bacterium Gr01-1014_72]|nr:MAG: hypothetical protein G01um101472_187 [Parcubacteria group bacterium Gr01-1014_72]
MKDVRELERVLKALANRRRLGILKFLKLKKEAIVGEIAEAIRLSFKSTSRHLSILSGAGVVEREQRSTEVFYSIRFAHPTVSHTSNLL